VAEALTFGTPVVSLDHGGPAELVRQWPESPSALVPPDKEDVTARSLAGAIDPFLGEAPPTLRRPQHPRLSFQEEVLSAYESAVSKFGPHNVGSPRRSASASMLNGPWIGLPFRSHPRWTLPKTPRSAAKAGLFVYHPVTLRARLGWEVARLVAGTGFLGLLPPSQPPVDLRDALAPFLPPRSYVAVARTNHPRRYVALGVDDDGKLLVVGKVARDQAGRADLRREREQMESLGPFLSGPIKAPRLLAYDDGVLVLEAVTWHPRLLPWHLSEDVAHALGVFFKRTMRAQPPMAGAAHGDFAPWNLMLGRDGTRGPFWTGKTLEPMHHRSSMSFIFSCSRIRSFYFLDGAQS
jgi:hypothetical protein